MTEDDGGRDWYARQTAAYHEEIARNLALRDAQTADSPRRDQFQVVLTSVTETLLWWESIVPRLRELDGLIAGAAREAEHWRNRAEHAASARARPAWFLAIAGVLLAGLWWLGAGAVVAVLALLTVLGAGALAWNAHHARADAEAAARRAGAQLNGFQTEYDQLRNGQHTPRR